MFDRPTPPHEPVTIERKEKRKRKEMRRKRDLLGWSIEAHRMCASL
jgi:hypothetical protein